MFNAISTLAPIAGNSIERMQGTATTRIRLGLDNEAALANPGSDFGSVFANVTQSYVTSLQRGEAAAVAGVQGKAPVQDVIAAVMSAERSLQFAMAIREKTISAYQQIMQQPV